MMKRSRHNTRASAPHAGADSCDTATRHGPHSTTSHENLADDVATVESATTSEVDILNDQIDEYSERNAKRSRIKIDEILAGIRPGRKVTLRDRLIKGQYEPQMLGMRVYNMKKVATAAAQVPESPADVGKPPRDFLVPAQPKHPSKSKHKISDSEKSSNGPATGSSLEDARSDPHIAYKSTPIHQLHFPEALILSVKQNASRWQTKDHRPDLVFVVMRVVSSDVPDLHVFTGLGEATAHALHLIAYKHPEAFALPQNNDNEGDKAKAVKSEQVPSLIKQVTARPICQQVPSGRKVGKLKGPKIVLSESSDSDTDDENPMLQIKEEDPELPRPPRIPDPRPDFNSRGQLLLRDAPEPTYVFWGKYNIASFGLKMEFRRADGTVVRVSVHRKTLRKTTQQNR
ncbi:hypothetical protein F5B22DRAFT_658798 [Xylaria bambusicola]|uniref:uncharacterized protein n=1 Tax=Xylaria bambusicola TaxID=326684 RepID=UPI002007C735|nr:uncharacterized protein F5B22DRAFT_658798 [Xylaria bambusicola]KAI0508882.1 hypothetical protein F5B22DRAFT_658798 [Xylaria bambusicola]